MSFTAYRTWVAGEVHTAAQLNQQVRDNGNILKTNIADDGTLRSWNLLTPSASSGTDTSVGATNLATCAIAGLTTKDMLVVKVVAKSVTQATANIGLYNSTDSVALNTAVASLAAGETLMITFDAAQSQASATAIDTLAVGKDTVPTVYNSIVVAGFTQNWTGSWTLTLRHGGVTAGGTLQWRWSVYRLAGQ